MKLSCWVVCSLLMANGGWWVADSHAESSAPAAESMPWRQMQQNTAASFVLIDYYPQKSELAHPDLRTLFDAEQRAALEKVLNENTTTAVGVIMSDTGEIFTTDRELQYPQTVAKITVTGWDGKVLPAQDDRLLVKAPGRILRLTEKLPETWKPLSFADLDPAQITPETSLYTASLWGDEHSRVVVRPCDYALNWSRTPGDLIVRLPGTEGLAVICNSQGQPVGVSVARDIETGPAAFAWRGKDILADAGVSAQERTQLEEKFKKEFARNIYEVTITFRPQAAEDGRGRFLDMARESTPERLAYGLAFDGDKVLVPGVMAREMIEGIDTVSVKVDDKPVEADFGGVLRQCEAMVFQLKEGKLPRTVPFEAEAKVNRIEPFWALGVREIAGMDVSVDCGRWMIKEQGFAEKWYPVPDRTIPAGSWLVDRQGRLVGYFGRGRRELDRLQGYLVPELAGAALAGRRGMAGSARPYPIGEGLRFFDAAELAPILSRVADNYDTHLRHLDKEQQKRRMWLGVEYTRPSKEMVKQMNLRQQTQDGRIGLVVNRIYPGSPAMKLGLAEGDILLKMVTPETPWPIDLISNERSVSYELPSDEEDAPEELRTLGGRGARGRPWPSRDNYLTRMLGEIGAGVPVKLTYLHESKLVEKDFVVEQAPPDLAAAAKYKNEKLGLTVKDLTYEVRAALRLTENDAAVVITEIEPGTPAAMARVNQYELIRAVDGQAVDSVRTFETLVAEAQKAEKESVRITVEWMGKTRLADMKFNARMNGPGFPRPTVPGVGGGSDQ